MSLRKSLEHLGERSIDQAVGFTSGTVPLKPLDTPRTTFIVVVSLVVVALSFSGWFLWYSINRATNPKLIVRQDKNAQAAATAQLAELEKLRDKDTDTDGITDYQELYATGTSPYLRDTDGDGINDLDEINQKTDPNCPQGKSCNPGLNPVGTTTNTASANSSADTSTSEVLRQALIASGAPEYQVDQTSDTTLTNSLQQATGQTNTTTDTTITSSDLQNLTGTEIRALLKQNGVDETTLSSVDDNTLRAVFGQALTQAEQNTNQ